MYKMSECKNCGTVISKSDNYCVSCGSKNKTPIYKNIWFWIISVIATVVLVVAVFVVVKFVGIISNDIKELNERVDSQTGEDYEYSEEMPEIKDGAIKAGTYKVGTDIEAGEYLFFAEDYNGYIECAIDSTWTEESILFSGTIVSHSYLTVKDGEYIRIESGEMYPVAIAPSVVPEDKIYRDGMYKVGQDIPAGEYKVKVVGTTEEFYGYYDVSTDSRFDYNTIVTEAYIEADTYLTVKEGQYLWLEAVEIHLDNAVDFKL